jgi:hypothetical protein
MFDYHQGGETLEEFLAGYPAVSREMAVAVLEEAKELHERFRVCFPGHDCQTARYARLGGLKNGDLLQAADLASLDVLLTVDQGLDTNRI